MNISKIVYILAMLMFANSLYANHAAITNANNQAFINGSLGYDKYTYGSNRPADAGGPLYNAQGVNKGVQFGLTKMFERIYSQFALSAQNTNINYEDALLAQPLSDGSVTTLSLDGRLGYSFYPSEQLAFTPYLVGAYIHQQLNSGGYTANFTSLNYNGATYLTQSFYYGLGVYNQWEVLTDWVLSADLQYKRQLNPWVTANVDNFNNQPGATTTYQQWNVMPSQFWQFALGSDYRFYDRFHFHAGVLYTRNHLGGENSSVAGSFPAQFNQNLLWSLGLGYQFSDILSSKVLGVDDHSNATHAVNNAANIAFGFEHQNFSGGTTNNYYRQITNLPTLGIVWNKTWRALFTQLAAKEGIAATYQGQNTSLDMTGKLGYQLSALTNTTITPYAILGYHRALQNITGAASNAGAANGIATTYYINGITETYQHSWYGLGLLMQWALSPKLVLNAEGNLGYSFNASMNSWAPNGLPLYTTYSLGNAGSQMANVGMDYAFAKNWHALANINYQYYRYAASAPNALGIATLSDSTSLLSANVGVGYSFG